MQNKKTLLIFPLVTQLIFSLLSGFKEGFSREMLDTVLLAVTIPAFLVALPCVKFNYHNRQLLPIGFWCGIIGFFYTLIGVLVLSNAEGNHNLSIWENTLMALLFALSYSLSAIIYGLVVLRPFLYSKPVSEKTV